MLKSKKSYLFLILVILVLVMLFTSFENNKKFDLENLPYEEWPGYSNVI